MPVAEKRGLEDLPEPILRPVSQTTTAAQSREESPSGLAVAVPDCGTNHPQRCQIGP